ncbi:MAG TPA: hypothetical protein VK797_22635 [Tepidisphaeraceae bacterium]|jgi:hypothetical protein|nr:hypothetical protein [Tepidisphaeraceae bacterium]
MIEFTDGETQELKNAQEGADPEARELFRRHFDRSNYLQKLRDQRGIRIAWDMWSVLRWWSVGVYLGRRDFAAWRIGAAAIEASCRRAGVIRSAEVEAGRFGAAVESAVGECGESDMKKMKTTTVRGQRIEADDLVVGLIDLLLKTERSLESVKKELDAHLEMIAELQPKLNPDGTITVLAMRVDGDSADEHRVTLMPIKPLPEKDKRHEEDDAQGDLRDVG